MPGSAHDLMKAIACCFLSVSFVLRINKDAQKANNTAFLPNDCFHLFWRPESFVQLLTSCLYCMSSFRHLNLEVAAVVTTSATSTFTAFDSQGARSLWRLYSFLKLMVAILEMKELPFLNGQAFLPNMVMVSGGAGKFAEHILLAVGVTSPWPDVNIPCD